MAKKNKTELSSEEVLDDAAPDAPAPDAPAPDAPPAADAAPAPAPAPDAADKLDKAKALFPAGGTFFLEGNPNGFTVLGEPELIDGSVHVTCEKSTGHTSLVCVDSLL